MYFRKLTGKKCYLSPINVDDAPKFTEWLNDLEITEGVTVYARAINLEGEKDALGQIKGHEYSIIDISTNEPLGKCGFIDLDHLNQTAEVGIFIGNKDYWNKGYGSEALRLLMDFGFKALNLHNIGLTAWAFNKRAIKCYEKIGFKVMGKRRQALLRGKDRFDIVHMDILRSEFYESLNGKCPGTADTGGTVV